MLLLTTVYCLLPTAYVLLTIYCSLLTAYCLLLTADSLPITTYYSLLQLTTQSTAYYPGWPAGHLWIQIMS